MLTIRGVNLQTGEAWNEAGDLDEAEARDRLATLRNLRGDWRTNPVVYAIVDPVNKKAHVPPMRALMAWMRQQVLV